MEEKVYLDKLAKRDIKPTAIRLLILKSMMEAGRAVSQLDLETLLDTVDKSTISRTITLFLSHHLIHSIKSTCHTGWQAYHRSSWPFFFPKPGLSFYRNDRCRNGWTTVPLACRYLCFQW